MRCTRDSDYNNHIPQTLPPTSPIRKITKIPHINLMKAASSGNELRNNAGNKAIRLVWRMNRVELHIPPELLMKVTSFINSVLSEINNTSFFSFIELKPQYKYNNNK